MVTEHCFIAQWSQIPAPESRANYKGVAVGLGWPRMGHNPRENKWFALIQWWAQLQRSKMWFSAALRGMSSSPCTSPKSFSMLVLKVSQTSLLSAPALYQCAMKKPAFYWRALMRWIKRRTESLKLRPVKFSLKIVLNDHRTWMCSVSQSTLPSSPAGNTRAQTLHLLTALSGCWICKDVQNQAVDIYGFFSDLPLPHKTSSLKHWFSFMCPGTQGPCVELWLQSEAGQSPAASLVVIFGAGFFQSRPPLTWSSALLWELINHFRSLLGIG